MTMKKIIILAAVAATLAACNNDENAFVDNRDPNVIYMTAGVDAVVVTRAAVTSFPNGANGSAKIAVVARYTNTDLATDWNSPYVDHVSANVAEHQLGYAFNWETGSTQYWPVSGEELQFLAYSPIANSSTVKKNATANKLDISLAATHTDMPDVIVANKTPGNTDIKGQKVNTGGSDGPTAGTQNPVTVGFQFKHILSQLDVVVKGANSNSNTVIDKVEVIVDKAQVKKTFDMTSDLTANAAGWETGGNAAGDLTYTYNSLGNLSTGTTINGATPILLFPGTQSGIKVKVWVKDNGATSAVELPTVTLSDAKTTGGANATLQTGKKTTLTITVNGVQIADMQGGVTDWVADNNDYNADIQ